MPASRHIQRSMLTAAAVAMFAGSVVADEQNAVQRLIERGALQEAVERAGAEGENVESTFFAAQALVKMDDTGGAQDRYAQLRERGDDSWRAIGESGEKLLAGDVNAAMAAANRAIEANGDNPYAHYQLGLIAAKQGNFQRSLQAFSRAIELKPDFAYAHYYAGQAAQKLKQTPAMAEHFQAFMRIAPEAPERVAVQAILRSLR